MHHNLVADDRLDAQIKLTVVVVQQDLLRRPIHSLSVNVMLRDWEFVDESTTI